MNSFNFMTIYFLSSKHPSAAQMLRDVGAVDFLTQLSPNVEPRLRAVIDGTLDQLFQLPELLPSYTMVYSHRQHSASPTGVASYAKYLVFRICHLQNSALVTFRWCFFQYPNGYFSNKCGISVVVPTVVPPEKHFPKMGYFQKNVPNSTDIPPQRIAGTVQVMSFLLPKHCPKLVHCFFFL